MRRCPNCKSGSGLSSFMEGPRLSGIGMTSARTRERLVQRLQEQGIAAPRVLHRIRNVNFRHDDGNVGWAARAPYDGILVTAAPHAVPPVLFEQLSVGGRLIAPVGPDGRQELYLYTKGETRIERRSLGSVSFVPLLSGLQR